MRYKISIAIAEDHLLVRQGLISLLKEFEEIQVLFDVSNGKELMDQLRDTRPDIILLDLEMPVMNGREAFEKIRAKYPSQKIIIVSSYFRDAYILEFISKGAAAFLNKTSSIEKIIDTLHNVHENGKYYDNAVATILASALSNKNGYIQSVLPDNVPISAREFEVLPYVCSNKSNRETAKSLQLSVRTVEGHRLSLFKKTGCKTPVELASYAIEHGLLKIL
jgi:DNA-binding NarL/FixJ family response regulator